MKDVGGQTQSVGRIWNVRNLILWMEDLMRNQVNTVQGKIGEVDVKFDEI